MAAEKWVGATGRTILILGFCSNNLLNWEPWLTCVIGLDNVWALSCFASLTCQIAIKFHVIEVHMPYVQFLNILGTPLNHS